MTAKPKNEQPSELQLAWQKIGALQAELDRANTKIDRLERRVAEADAKAYHDTLTGLKNRLAFDEERDRMVGQQLRGQSSLQLVMVIIDFDGFKKINDKFGHPAGDALLAKTTGEMNSLLRLRQGDILARIGGDEFAILAMANNPEGFIKKKIRSTQERFDRQYNRRPEDEKIRLSIGYAVLNDETVEKLYPGHTLASLSKAIKDKKILSQEVAVKLYAMADADLYEEKAFRKYPFPQIIDGTHLRLA